MTTNNSINSPSPIDVPSGGTGVASTTAYAVICGGTTSTGAHQPIASVGTSGQVLTSNGAGALPTFQAAGASSGKILQVVSTAKTSVYTTSTTSATDITGMSVTITPSAITSKVLVTFTLSCFQSGSNALGILLIRGSTQIGLGDASGSKTQVSVQGIRSSDGLSNLPLTFTFLDSPATTSATTYKLQSILQGGTFYVNQTVNDTDASIPSSGGGRSASSITVMEVSA